MSIQDEQNEYLAWFEGLTFERQREVRNMIKVLLYHGNIKWACLTAKALLELQWSK